MNKYLLVLLLVAGGANSQSHLDSVHKQGVLTVCTTGDYKPYTYLRPDGNYDGIDVSMAESLAKSLNVKLKWVKTSWKMLMPDFQIGKCDIAMGGISVTLQRQNDAFFSQPLDIDGKIPLVRCENKERYKTIDQMNNKIVRLIEPAGGTNEVFVRTYLPKATLTLHDNVTIFQQLVDKQADVMITEASEALFQQKQHTELCAVNPKQPLQYGEKAYMLPRDDISWKFYVDQWLHLSKQTGEYQMIVDKWLAVEQ